MAMPETPQGNLPAELDAKKQNIDEYKNATAAPTPAAPKATSTLAVDKVNTPPKRVLVHVRVSSASTQPN